MNIYTYLYIHIYTHIYTHIYRGGKRGGQAAINIAVNMVDEGLVDISQAIMMVCSVIYLLFVY
jgi:hypothetical protein